LLWRRRLYFYPAWFAAFGFSLVVGGYYTFGHEYTSLPWAPVNAAFMGAGLLVLREKASALRPRPRAWALAGLLLLAAAMPVYSVLRIRHWYGIGSPAVVGAAAAADRVGSPDDLFLCNSFQAPMFLFYLHRRGWGVAFEGDPAAAWAELDRLIAGGARFFFTTKSGPFQDRDGELARRFYARFPVAYDEGGLLIFRLR
ncbi:MAG: hypothetical protein PHU21_08700, partial [Elusimicrobia bacterium]|nr:hypothetical protein [Elusimicrobiota bacterium]